MQPLTFATPKGDILLREGTPADAPQFRDLRLQALLGSPTAFSADYETMLNQPMSYWEGRLKFDEHGAIYLAEQAGALIGMTGVSQRPSPKTRHTADIFSVFVAPEWRGLRIAEALLERCAHWARTRSITILKLGVISSNTPAVRCYERCGFKVYGTEPQDIFFEGKYYDLHLMARELT